MSSRNHGRRHRIGAPSDREPDCYDFLFDADSDSRRAARKTGQLCREVQRALAAALGALDDPLLAAAYVVAVTPAPDAGRLLVTVAPPAGATDLALLLERLRRAAGELREELAADLQRKRTPELAFALAVGGEP
jgi:ribosome-binding factor A